MSTSQPRGFRNNNPLNIRKGSNWKGLASIQSDKEFCVFSSMYYGLRAALYLLLKYYVEYGLHTLYDIISRWAPECENNTLNYSKLVANELKMPEKFIATLDLDLPHDDSMLYCLLSAMIYVENGIHLSVSGDDFYNIINNEIPSSFR